MNLAAALLLTLALVGSASALAPEVEGSAGWRQGRATFYGGSQQYLSNFPDRYSPIIPSSFLHTAAFLQLQWYALADVFIQCVLGLLSIYAYGVGAHLLSTDLELLCMAAVGTCLRKVQKVLTSLMFHSLWTCCPLLPISMMTSQVAVAGRHAFLKRCCLVVCGSCA